jgi:hypothetical protein
MPTDVIRRISIQAAQIGVTEAAEALKRLSNAQDNVASSQLTVQSATEKYQRQLDISNRQSQQFSAAQRTVAMDLASVRDVLVSVAAGIYVAKSAYDAIAAGSDAASLSMGRANSGMMNGARDAVNFLPGIIAAVWQQGIDKLNQYVELSQKAGALGTDFYQTLTIAAANAKKPADEYLKVVENIGKALERQLGSNGNQNGSAFNSLATDLQKGGNLQGQLSGISRVNNAITGPEQLNAAFTLIKGVLNAGETLVALKLAGTLLGPEAAANLKNDNDYIFKIEQSIKSVQDKDIIKQADIDRAAGLKVELDNAKKIIDSWFTSKASGDWSALGTEIQQLWVNANSNFAAILKIVDSIFFRSKEIADIKPDPEGSLWTKIGDSFTDGTIQKLTDATRAYAIAEGQLASRLRNPQNVANAGAETQRAGDLFGDQSIPAGASAATKDATASILANAAATKLQADNAGRSAGAIAAATTAAQLDAAALKDGLSPEVERLTARYSLLVQAATDAADALERANKAKAAQDAYKAGTDSVQAYIEATNLQIKFYGTTSEAAGRLKEAQVNAQLYSLALKDGLTPEQANATVAATGLGKAAGEAAAKMAELNKKPEANDQVDRAINTLTRHIETQKADTLAVGLGDGALARFRAQAQETAAVLANGGNETDKQRAAFAKLKDEAFAAADGLARAKVASQIEWGKKTAFLSAEDVQIAQQLSGIYGNNVPAALASSEAAALRFNNQLKSMSDLARSSATSFTNDLISGLGSGQTAVESLHNAFKNLASTLTSSALKSLFEGDFVSAGIKGIAAIGAAIFSANTSSSGEKWLKQQKEDMAVRQADYASRITLAGVDTNTRAGAILAQDQQFIRERIAENKAGGQAMNALLQAEVDERNALLTEWAQKETDLVKANADAKLAIEKAAADRSLAYQDRLFAATNNFDTLEGQLAAFDRTATQDRLKEMEAGGQAIVDLEAAQAAERYNVIKNFNDKTLQALNATARGVTDFISNLKGGSASTYSPQETLANAQTLYNANLTLAQSGNADAQSKWVGLADNLEKALRTVFASGEGYQTGKNLIINQGLGLPAVQATTDPVTQAVRDAITAINASNTAQTGKLNSVIANTLSVANVSQGYLPGLYVNTGNTNANVDTNNALVIAGNNLVTSSNSFLTAINTFADRIIQALNAQGAMQAGNFAQLIQNSAILLNWQPILAYRTAGDGGGTSVSVPYTAHAMGGVIPAYGLGLVSEHSNNPRFLRAGPEPITVSPYAPVPSFRGSNDNGNNAAILAELRANREELKAVRAELAEVKKTIAGGAVHIREGVDAVQRDTGDLKRAGNMRR